MMGELCPVCGGRLPSSEDFCKVCFEQEKAEFQAVKQYLRAFPNSNAMQVANATGVSVSKISKYVRQGLLSKADNNNDRYNPRKF